MMIFRILAGAVLLCASSAGFAFDFKSIGPTPVVLYDAPSQKGGKLYIAPRGMPVEVVLAYGDWVKVRDASGDVAWTEARLLSPKRMVVVRSASARVRAAADEAAAPVMVVDKSVLLELVDGPAAGWAKVRHRDGSTGFIRVTDVWGV